LQLMADAVGSIVPLRFVLAEVQLPPLDQRQLVLKLGSKAFTPDIPAEWQSFVALRNTLSFSADHAVEALSPLGPLQVLRFHLGTGLHGQRIWFGSLAKSFPTARQSAFLRAAGTLTATGLNTARLDFERDKANRAKDEFMAMLGHELRNPLAPIVTTLSLIKMKGPGQLASEYAVIERQVAHLGRLVDDLLDVTRITRDKVELRLETFLLGATVAAAVEGVSPLVQEKKHRITVDADSLDVLINGDAGRIRQVFANLLNNAAKYTPPGGDISVSASTTPGWVSIFVRDNGSGILAELLGRVFNLFEQGKSTIDRSEGGLGIGLAIVKKLVQLHGGTVSAESEGTGKGSVFTVTLPMVEVLPPIAPVSATDHSTTGGLRVLLVDDNIDAMESMAAVLDLYGFTVLAVGSPAEALEKALAFKPDVFVLDIGLPGLNGYELAAELRKLDSGELQNAKFIALTGYGQASDKARARQEGFHHHLTKPVQVDDLVAAIQPTPMPTD
jgi:signal transduction histidine kinase/ActR/RegA family two-component response regulator